MSTGNGGAQERRLLSVAGLSADVADQFNRFLLFKKRSGAFNSVCERLKVFFRALGNPEPEATTSESSGAASFRANARMLRYVLEKLDRTSETSVKDACDNLEKIVAKIQNAKDLAEVEQEVQLFRDGFLDLASRTFRALEPGREEVEVA